MHHDAFSGHFLFLSILTNSNQLQQVGQKGLVAIPKHKETQLSDTMNSGYLTQSSGTACQTIYQRNSETSWSLFLRPDCVHLGSGDCTGSKGLLVALILTCWGGGEGRGLQVCCFGVL